MRKTKILLIMALVALALTCVSPTLMNSFGRDAQGWNLSFLNPAYPTSLALMVTYSAVLMLAALGGARIARSTGRLVAFLSTAILGGLALAVTFVAMCFFLAYGQEYASKSFLEEWRFWAGTATTPFIITHATMSIAAAVMACLATAPLFPTSNATPNGDLQTDESRPATREHFSLWRRSLKLKTAVSS